MLSAVLVGQRAGPAHCGGGRLGVLGERRTQNRRVLCEQLLSKVPHASNMCRWMWGGWGRAVGEVGAQAPNEHSRVPGLCYNLCESSKNQNKGPE